MLEFDLHKTFQSADSTTKIYCHGNVEAGSITVLYGRSGIGKSTILRMIAGLEIPDDGSINFLKSCWFSKKERVLLKASSRETGFVFQDYNLFPNMTVERNLRYASPDGLLSEEIVQILRQLNLEHLLKKYPEKLSGGQRQRIAIIRALCQKPKLLLMDEPFSALDDDAINDLIDTLKYLRKSTGMTLLIVSHRKDVVLQLADSVIHMTQNGCTQGSASEIIL